MMVDRKITLEQIKHVARLARLAINEEDAVRAAEQLETILEYVARINELDVTDVEPMAHALAVQNALRQDAVTEPLPVETVLMNAPERDGPFFKVPKVIGVAEDSAG